MAWTVSTHPDAEAELDAIPPNERVALAHAIEKLRVYGDRLGAPHSSSIRGVKGTLRELRPRGGRSRWRAFYRRVGGGFVIAAFGPEASVNPSEFRRAAARALLRLESSQRATEGDTSNERR